MENLHVLVIKKKPHIHKIVERVATNVLFHTFWMSIFGSNIINHKK